MENSMRAEHVIKCYRTAGQDFYALNDVSIEIPKGKLTILRGRSGSGKTTLMNMLGALDTPTQGKIFLGDSELVSMSDRERTQVRRNRMGFVFQSVALIPVMSAIENVDFALRMAGYKGDRIKRAEECLKLVGLLSRKDHLPQMLSGGEQQRIAIARAIAHAPEILFADEPTGALDTASGLSVIKIFKELTEKEGVTIVMTTHDVGLMEYGDRVYELLDGKVISGGTEDE